jgi:N-glycosylase/DNA lyase
LELQLGLAGVPFSLEYTLDSGQVFRWANKGEWWYAVISGEAVKVKQEGDALYCGGSSEKLDSSFFRDYFRLDEDLQAVYASIAKDPNMNRAVQRFYGMRLLRQDPWECLASFVLATNSNIPSIKRMVANVAAAFGKALTYDGASFATFPSAEDLAGASISDLQACGLGYRAPFLKKVAQAVDEGKVDFSELKIADYVAARETLLRRVFGEKLLLGVGPKVADCTLLFSCDKDEAFPIDVWIARALALFYPALIEEHLRARLTQGVERGDHASSAAGGRRRSKTRKVALSRRDYDSMSQSARQYFGGYAGYAQQYLFMLARAERLTDLLV